MYWKIDRKEIKAFSVTETLNNQEMLPKLQIQTSDSCAAISAFHALRLLGDRARLDASVQIILKKDSGSYVFEYFMNQISRDALKREFGKATYEIDEQKRMQIFTQDFHVNYNRGNAQKLVSHLQHGGVALADVWVGIKKTYWMMPFNLSLRSTFPLPNQHSDVKGAHTVVIHSIHRIPETNELYVLILDSLSANIDFWKFDELTASILSDFVLLGP